jgi:hypothetical protein
MPDAIFPNTDETSADHLFEDVLLLPLSSRELNGEIIPGLIRATRKKAPMLMT